MPTPYTDLFLSHSSNTYVTGLHYKLDSGLELEGAHQALTSSNNDNRISLEFRLPL